MRKKHIIHAIIFSVAIFLAYGPGYATQPGQLVNPNGFPSGPHYNLNIHGKNTGFTCPDQKYYMAISTCPINGCGVYSLDQLVETCPEGFGCSQTSTPIYGNSIFVPEIGEGIEIYMQSGKLGGKGSKASSLPQSELWAIDPCAGFDGDKGVIQLPPGEYDVYARALATPTDNPSMTVIPQLVGVEDEFGNDLIYLGLVTDNGFQTETQSFTRTKGKSTAIPITGLFEWTGEVCYFSDPGDGAIITQKCCIDNDLDGIYDDCTGDVSACPGTNVDTYCKTYSKDWIFNIGDFVNYLWEANNSGLKLLQVRFYPRQIF